MILQFSQQKNQAKTTHQLCIRNRTRNQKIRVYCWFLLPERYEKVQTAVKIIVNYFKKHHYFHQNQKIIPALETQP